MTSLTRDPDLELSSLIRDLRSYLMDNGFEHTRRSGELAAEGFGDKLVGLWVRTGYTHGSYRVNVYGRVNGARQGQHFIDFNRGVDPSRIIEFQKAIANWDGQVWPPHPDMVRAETGQGKGWPQWGR